MNEQDANKILESVRVFFDKGHKSGNKKYAKSSLFSCCTPNQARKILQRFINQKSSVEHRLSFTDDYYTKHAQLLLGADEKHRSGNCFEMAILSAESALREYSVPHDQIFICTVSRPGDHVFCLIGSGITKKYFNNVSDLCSAGYIDNIIIDPWLNISTKRCNYTSMVSLKLDAWAGQGKRLYWEKDNRAGWFSPVGDYEDTLINKAPVRLHLYTEKLY